LAAVRADISLMLEGSSFFWVEYLYVGFLRGILK